MKRIFLMSVFSFFLSGASHAAVNCSNPSSGVDRLICTSSRASVAQVDMSFSYNLAMRRGVDLEILQKSQTEWHNEVLGQCNDVTCVVDAMVERTTDIENMDGIAER